MKWLLITLVLSVSAFAQVPVLLAPVPHLQFLDANGHPLANGKLFTYDAGTTNLRNTYVDSTGTTQNTDPIILDATGSPSNGSVQTGVWLANQAYKFVAQNSLGVQQWSTDNVTGYFGLLNTINTWTQPQTFTQPITITPVDNQIITGVVGNQTTLDYPPPVGNVTLHFPNTNDTIVGRATTDTLTNKTLTSPILNSPVINTGTFSGLSSTSSPLASTGILKFAAADSACWRSTTNAFDHCITTFNFAGVSQLGIDGAALDSNTLGFTGNSAISVQTPAASNGSALQISAGGGNGTNKNGGSLELTPGGPTGSGTAGTLILDGGIAPFFGSGVKHVRVASCSTGAGAASTCTTTVSWGSNFADTSYTAVCSIDTPTGTPYVLNNGTKTISGLSVVIANLTAIVSSGTINCIAFHD